VIDLGEAEDREQSSMSPHWEFKRLTGCFVVEFLKILGYQAKKVNRREQFQAHIQFLCVSHDRSNDTIW
jgi:hypothetical protein